ncbi:MAG TPA: acyl carrier protein [Candidatus Sulfomarinibacteraceae bacterium]|nr:acyl carrier protein [Candidatus Sulfomarinibacteraceae bacterium]
MNRAEIVLSVIARVGGVPVESLSPGTELVADLDMDSAKALELLVELEDRLGLEIDDDDAAGLATVGDILALVESLDG